MINLDLSSERQALMDKRFGINSPDPVVLILRLAFHRGRLLKELEQKQSGFTGVSDLTLASQGHSPLPQSGKEQ